MQKTLYKMRKITGICLFLFIVVFLSSCKTNEVTYSLTFQTNGGSSIEDYTFESLDDILLPSDPTRTGFIFLGWYLDAMLTTPFSLDQIQNQTDITLYASWEVNTYTATYHILPYGDNPSLIKGLYLQENEKIEQIYSGYFHSGLITSFHRVFVWGSNSDTQLGDGTSIDRTIPTEITHQFALLPDEYIITLSLGYDHSAALTSSGRLFTWGDNSDGELGNGTITNQDHPIDITSMFNLYENEQILKIIAKDNQTVALTSQGRMFIWGDNQFLQLIDGSFDSNSIPHDITTLLNLSEGESILSLSLGSGFVGVLTTNHRLLTWGYNELGQLGSEFGYFAIGFPVDITDRFVLNESEVIQSISFGSYHASALTSEGRLFIWGYNGEGAIGNNSYIDTNTPTDITVFFALETEEEIISISMGEHSSFATTSINRVFTWGNNESGQLGVGTYEDSAIPIEVSFIDLEDEEYVTFAQMGVMHTIFITSHGSIYVCGDGINGQLGNGSITSDIKSPFELPIILLNEFTTIEYVYGQELNYNPVLEGYTFSGWYLDENLTIPMTQNTMSTEHIILFGRFIP